MSKIEANPIDSQLAVPGYLRQYHPDLIYTIRNKFSQHLIRYDEGAFDNKMPLYLVGSAENVVMLSMINGDVWQSAVADLAFGAGSFRINPDIAGQNAKDLTVFLLFADCRQDRRTRKPIKDSPQDAIVKSQGVFVEPLVGIIKNIAQASKVVTVDIHSYIASREFAKQGLPLLNITTAPLFANRLLNNGMLEKNLENIIVTTDEGDFNRAVPLSKILKIPIAVMLKHRIPITDTQREISTNLYFGDIRGKRVIIFDDMISSGKTLLETAKKAVELGAIEIIFCASHAIFVGNYLQNLKELLSVPQVKSVLTTDILPLKDRRPVVDIPSIRTDDGKLKQVEVIKSMPLIGKALSILLKHKDIDTIIKKLGNAFWDMQDPYNLASQITNTDFPKRTDTAIYYEGGNIVSFSASDTIFQA